MVESHYKQITAFCQRENDRRAAFKDLLDTLTAGRGAAKHQQKQMLIQAVKERDRNWGLFD
jgi:hypothetical protein